MKVAMVVKELQFGWASHTEPLAAALKKQGVEVDLRSGNGGDLKTCQLARQLAKNTKYDLLHVQGSPYAGLIRRTKIPLVTTVHTTLWTEQQFGGSLSAKMGVHLENRALAASNAVIIVNEILRQELQSVYKVPAPKIFHVHNAVDTDEFDKYPDRERGKFAFSCGRDIARKGFDTLEKACADAMFPVLVIHGELSRSQLIWEYKLATMFVCASVYETGPITVMEAMAAKCPVICSDIPAVHGLVSQGMTGLLFEPGNVKQLARKITFLFDNGGFAEALAERAYMHVKEHYNWTEAAQKTIEVYEEATQ